MKVKEIENAPGYRVTSDGDILSCWEIYYVRGKRGSSSRMSSAWKVLAYRLASKWGHGAVYIKRGGKYSSALIHRLVLEAFTGKCPPGYEACHNDGNPRNNNITNLRWDTKLNNMADKAIHGTKYKLTDKQTRVLRWAHSFGSKQAFLAKVFHVSQSGVSRILSRKSLTPPVYA